jgi:putative ABC transport system ATP-binding protein
MTASTPLAETGRISVRNVRKFYQTGDRAVEALRGVNLLIDSPGFYGIMGPSGSGKSSLLHLLAGLDQPDEGDVEVDGCRLHSMNESELTLYRRRRIGIIFQQFNLIPTLTALQNVALPGVLDAQTPAATQSRAAELLSDLGLADRGHHRPDALSGGEQQRVAIARSLYFSPRFLLADEPTGNLDSASSQRLWNLLNQLALDRNITVLMVTHEPAAAAHCRRVFVMHDGVIAHDFDTEGLDAAQLATRAAYLGRLAG